jgi:hypothetical protein
MGLGRACLLCIDQTRGYLETIQAVQNSISSATNSDRVQSDVYNNDAAWYWLVVVCYVHSRARISVSIRLVWFTGTTKTSPGLGANLAHFVH